MFLPISTMLSCDCLVNNLRVKYICVDEMIRVNLTALEANIFHRQDSLRRLDSIVVPDSVSYLTVQFV